MRRTPCHAPSIASSLPRAAAALAASFAFVAHLPPAHAQPDKGVARVPAFSAAAPGPVPAPWEVAKVNERKKLTDFDIVDDGGTRVLHARADASSSGMGVRTAFDLAAMPNLAWRWKIAGLIDGADTAVAGKEDAPARVMLTFDGDKDKLPFSDRTTIGLASKVYGRDLPYATLMYVWSNEHPVGTVIPNPHTRRIQMIVVASGKAGVGQWQSYKRNVRDDYRKAFGGEEPGRLATVVAFTDSDNTGLKAEAWYGDFVFSP